MAITFLASASANDPAFSSATAGPISTLGASLIVVQAGWSTLLGGSAPALNDSKSNSWSQLTQRSNGGNLRDSFYYVVNPTTDGSHTFTLAGANSLPSISVIAFSGTKTSSPFDTENFNSSSSAVTSITTNSITPSEDNEVVIACTLGSGSGSRSYDGGFTNASEDLTDLFVVSIGYLIQTSAAAANPTISWTGTGAVIAMIASFKAAAAATPSLKRNSLLNGLGASGPFFNNPLG